MAFDTWWTSIKSHVFVHERGRITSKKDSLSMLWSLNDTTGLKKKSSITWTSGYKLVHSDDILNNLVISKYKVSW